MLLLLTIATVADAQQGLSTEIQAWANVRLATPSSGWDPGRNGGGIAVGIRKTLTGNFLASVSGEMGAAGIGNYLALKAGAGMPLEWGASRWVYTPELHVLQGMALARPDPLYMWGLEQTHAIDVRLKDQSGPGLVIGLRFYGFPGYSEFSPIRSFFDLKAGLRYTF